MSKEYTKDELIFQKDSMMETLNSLLSEYIESSDAHLNKKVSLLSYWLSIFAEYIRREDDFDPTRLKSYKRGDIVKLNFGFNVGSEYGGLHYAVVINNHNDRNSPVLTVIPLTSQKDGAKIHPNDVFLGNEIYKNLKLKHDTILKNLESEREEIVKMNALFDSLMQVIDEKLEQYDAEKNVALISDARRNLDTANAIREQWNEKARKNSEASRQLKKIGDEIGRMKEGSIALIDQITTISKMRIYDPRNARGVLSGIRLSGEALNKINDKLKELFIF